MSFFTIVKKDKGSEARAGVLHTLHGDLETPALMIVGTKATVKGITPAQLEEMGVSVVLANTYHLYLSPGADLIRSAGGLHGFMNWQKPIFTDSGGFQIFSMGHGTVADEIKGRNSMNRQKTLLKLTEDGAHFKSYLDGSIHLFTPEKSIQIQYDLGADMIAVLDECTPFHVTKRYTELSMEMTHRWLDRCIAEHKRLKSKQALYGIIQGGVYEDLRNISAEYVGNSATPGICIGGSLGKDKEQMNATVRMTQAILPKEKPIHLLGIGGDLVDLITGVENGMDTFDCVAPTRNARHGTLFHKKAPNHKLQITNSAYRADLSPIDENCDCYVCQNFSRAYVAYLLRANEMLGVELCSYHNIHFVVRFMREMRQAILDERFEGFKEEWGA